MKQRETLFDIPPKPRAKPKKRMHVIDAGDAPGGYSAEFPNRCSVRYSCRRCQLETRWLIADTLTEAKRGIPCPTCNDETPLFVPLKAKHFDAFAAGQKWIEFRPYGPRWNERTCTLWRPVTLSRGYGRRHRLRGMVDGFEVSQEPTQTADWRDCYGPAAVDVACIHIHTFETEQPNR